METMSKVSDAFTTFQLEAEQAVLGAVLADAQCLIKVTDLMSKKDSFYKTAHQINFRSLPKIKLRKMKIST